MENLDWIDERIRNLFGGIRAEVILTDILEAGVDIENIVFAPIGTSKRSFNKDLYNAQWVELKNGKLLYYLYLTREGIYDAIPEGVIHQPQITNQGSAPGSMRQNVKVEKMEEQDARKFFLPFEQEFYYQRIALEKEERKLLSELKENNSDIFINFWKLDNCLNQTQKSILLNILPISHKIVSNFDLTAQCFEMVLGTKVTIHQIEAIDNHVPDNLIAGLGDAILGANMVLGNTCNDGYAALEIEIGPLKEDNLVSFIPGGIGHQVLDFLCDYFIPVELDVRKKVVVDDSIFDAQIGPKPTSMRLGLNVCLNKEKKSPVKK